MKKIDIQTTIFGQTTSPPTKEESAEINNYQQMLRNGEITAADYNKLTSTSLYSTPEPLNEIEDNLCSNTKEKVEENYSAQIKDPFEPSYLTYKEDNLARKFFKILSNTEYINEESLLENLNKIQKRDLTAVLEYYRRYSKGVGLLNAINDNSKISSETKKKFQDSFTKILEKDYKFVHKYTNNNDKVTLSTNDYSYESDVYNIKQTDTNTLEITNSTTNEKKCIDFNKLTPENLNGISDIISLKATIQKLPGEVLFQIPDEISFILSKNVIDAGAILKDKNADQYNGVVAMLGENKDIQLFISTESPDTLVHELGHAIFFDKNGKNKLLDNEKFITLYENGCQSVEKSGLNPNQPQFNWTQSPDELCADIYKSVMLNDKKTLDIIETHAPGATKIVMEYYKEVKNNQKEEKHSPYDGENFLKNMNNIL